MIDKAKVIKGMEMCISQYECSPDDCPYYIRPNNESGLCWDRLMTDALSLLKEQEEEIENLKQTAQSMMEGIIVSQPQIVRCKDCKHWKEGVCFDSVIPSPCPNKDWFCADGERREVCTPLHIDP